MGKAGQRRLWLSLVMILLSVFAVVAAVTYRQRIIDQIVVWRFVPDTAVSQLATDSGMSGGGRFHFYASRPQLDDREQFNSNCTQKERQSVVLGCYVGRRIFIFNVNDERINGVKAVTAAHEMLHAVYERLSDRDRRTVDSLVEKQLAQTTDQRILDLVAIYDRAEPGQRLNELHSIFGTEVAELSPELEAHYAHYFDDRQIVVKLSQQYQSVFDQLRDEQAALVARLEGLKDEIERLSATYENDVDTLSADIKTFNARAARSGGFATQTEFDAARAELMARQSQLNNDANAVNAKIDEYNRGVGDLNALGVEAEKLQNNLDSRSQEIQ